MLSSEDPVVLSCTLQAMGIDETQLALQVNTDRIDPNRGISLTRDFLSKLAEIHAHMGARREKTDLLEPLARNVPQGQCPAGSSEPTILLRFSGLRRLDQAAADLRHAGLNLGRFAL